MPTSSLFDGARYSVRAWLDADGEQVSATEMFIKNLDENNDSDAAALVHLLDLTSTHGPPTNKQKFRYLKGNGRGLVEFKARGGSRILGFIDGDRHCIICTHGIPKLKERRFDREVEKAQLIRQSYLFENAPEGGIMQ